MSSISSFSQGLSHIFWSQWNVFTLKWYLQNSAMWAWFLFSSSTFSVRYRWSMCSKNSIWLLLNECMICWGTEAEAHDKPVSPSYQNTSATTVIPLSDLHLCRFLCAVLHIFLAWVGNLLLCCAGRRVGLWRFLVDLDTLNVVLLMVPWLMTCSDTDRCWPWCRW